jgi:hypothetical protein
MLFVLELVVEVAEVVLMLRLRLEQEVVEVEEDHMLGNNFQRQT